MNSLAPGYSIYKIPFSLFVYKKEGSVLWVLTQKQHTTIDSQGIKASN